MNGIEYSAPSVTDLGENDSSFRAKRCQAGVIGLSFLNRYRFRIRGERIRTSGQIAETRGTAYSVRVAEYGLRVEMLNRVSLP
jgi:hypothetical protein